MFHVLVLLHQVLFAVPLAADVALVILGADKMRSHMPLHPMFSQTLSLTQTTLEWLEAHVTILVLLHVCPLYTGVFANITFVFAVRVVYPHVISKVTPVGETLVTFWTAILIFVTHLTSVCFQEFQRLKSFFALSTSWDSMEFVMIFELLLSLIFSVALVACVKVHRGFLSMTDGCKMPGIVAFILGSVRAHATFKNLPQNFNFRSAFLFLGRFNWTQLKPFGMLLGDAMHVYLLLGGAVDAAYSAIEFTIFYEDRCFLILSLSFICHCSYIF